MKKHTTEIKTKTGLQDSLLHGKGKETSMQEPLSISLENIKVGGTVPGNIFLSAPFIAFPDLGKHSHDTAYHADTWTPSSFMLAQAVPLETEGSGGTSEGPQTLGGAEFVPGVGNIESDPGLLLTSIETSQNSGAGTHPLLTLGESPFSPLGFTGALSALDDSLASKTTASSTESLTGFVEGSERFVDGLFGIPYENVNFELISSFEESQRLASSLSNFNLETPDEVNALNISPQATQLYFTNENFSTSFQSETYGHGNILDDNIALGTGLSLDSVGGQTFAPISYNGDWTLNLASQGIIFADISGGWSITFSTATDPTAFVFNNTASINFFPSATSTITTSGMTTEDITNVSVTFHDFSHPAFAFASASLTSPEGQTQILFPTFSKFANLSHVDLTFDDTASANIDTVPNTSNAALTFTTQSGQSLTNILSPELNFTTEHGNLEIHENGNYIFSADGNNAEIQAASTSLGTVTNFTDSSIPYSISDSQGSSFSGTITPTVEITSVFNID